MRSIFNHFLTFSVPSGHPLADKIDQYGAVGIRGKAPLELTARGRHPGVPPDPQNGRQGLPQDPQMEVQGYPETPKIRRSTLWVLVAACKMNFLCLLNPYSVLRGTPPVPPDRPRDSPKINLFSTLIFYCFLEPRWSQTGPQLGAKILQNQKKI